MKKLLLAFVLACTSGATVAHETQLLEVGRMWVDPDWPQELKWLIKNTVPKEKRGINCVGFDKKGEPLFQRHTGSNNVRDFATQLNTNMVGWNAMMVGEIKCVYEKTAY